MSQHEWNLHDWLFPKGVSRAETVTQVTLTRKMNQIGRGMFETVCDELPLQYQVMDELLWMEKGCMIWESPIGWICTAFSVKGYDLNGNPNRFKPKMLSLNEGYRVDDMFKDSNLPELTSEECQVFTDRMQYGEGRRDALTWIKDYVDVTETIRQQVFNQKTPMLGIAGNPKIKRKLQNAFTSIGRNVKALFVDQDIRDSLVPIDFNAPYNVNDLQLYRKQLESMMLEMMGVDSKEPTVKKAQTQVDEIEGNDELLNYILADCLRARERGVERCKDLGLHARTRIQDIVRPIQKEEDGVGGDDGDDTEDPRMETAEGGRPPLGDRTLREHTPSVPVRRPGLVVHRDPWRGRLEARGHRLPEPLLCGVGGERGRDHPPQMVPRPPAEPRRARGQSPEVARGVRGRHHAPDPRA